MAIWVTGAGSGIGQAVAALARERGNRVIGVDRLWPAGADREDARTCDLSDLASVVRLAEEWSDNPPEALVNCAGLAGTAPLEKLLTVNVLAPRLLGEALLALARPAAIVQVASGVAANWRLGAGRLLEVTALSGDALLARAETLIDAATPAYTLSKQLLCAHAAQLAARGIGLGLRVNCVLPGPVETPLLPDFNRSMGADALEWTRGAVGRFGTAREIAEAVLFLLSPQASWINGAEIQVDGGLRAVATVSPRPN